MAYSNVQNSGKLRTSSGAGLSWTPGSAPTLNNLLTGRFWGWPYTPASTDVKDSSGTPVNFAEDKASPNQDSMNAAVYSLLVPSGLTTPLKNVNTATALLGIFDEWSGNATSSVLDVTASNNSTTGVTSGTSGSLNTGANAGIIFAVVAQSGAGSADTITTTGTSFTNDATEANNNTYQAGSADERTASVASQSGVQDSWTFAASGTYTALIASYNASSGTTLSGGPTLTGVALAGTLAETYVLQGGPTLGALSLAGTLAETYSLTGALTVGRLAVAGALVADPPRLTTRSATAGVALATQSVPATVALGSLSKPAPVPLV